MKERQLNIVWSVCGYCSNIVISLVPIWFVNYSLQQKHIVDKFRVGNKNVLKQGYMQIQKVYYTIHTFNKCL